MQIYPEIFKRTSTGATQIWFMERYEDKHRTVSGQKYGKWTFAKWTTCTPKNVGKSNETSPEEQARLEVDALYKKKLELDYWSSEDDIDKSRYVKPMLAYTYGRDRVVKWDEGEVVYSQPKLDGIRCITTKDGLFTRKGKRIVSCPHIIEDLAPSFKRNPLLVLDGELYNHALKDDFNKITSLVRKAKTSEDDIAESAELVQYHIYDSVESVLTYDARRWSLSELPYFNPVKNSLYFVDTRKCVNQENLDALYKDYIEEGYEGQIIRFDEPYQNKRSKSLLKRKEFKDAEFEIVKIEEGQGNWSGYAKRVTCLLPDGRTFGSGIKGNQEFCAQLLKDKDSYVGKCATVKYFTETPDGIPRFGVAIDFGRTDNA